jgi:hypothetical protein
MSFRKKPSSTWSERAEARKVRSKMTSPEASVVSGLLVRTVLIALLAIGGATWALVRHYTHTPPPMRVPVPRAAPTYDADAGEIPIPDELEDLGAPDAN